MAKFRQNVTLTFSRFWTIFEIFEKRSQKLLYAFKSVFSWFEFDWTYISRKN